MMDFILQITGFLIAVVVLVQVVLTLRMSLHQYQLRRKLMHQHIEDAGQTFKIHRLSQEHIQQQESLVWNGYRKFHVDRKEYEDRNGNICSFYLVPHDGRRLPAFLPGQFLTLRLNIVAPQDRRQRGRATVRCYSLSDYSRNPEYYRITVKRLSPQKADPDTPPGVVSNFLHDYVGEGDILDIEAPKGKFCLDMTSQTPVVLIGGGIGITPMLSMLNTIAESDSSREVWFFYGTLNSDDIIMNDHLIRLAKAKENVHVHRCYSKPYDEDIQEADTHTGHVSVDLFKRLLPSSNYSFYICGPPPMMQSITQDLNTWGVSEEHIFFEAFGPATVKPQVREESKDTASDLTVTFSKSGETYPWDPETLSILDFAESKGVSMDAGCRIGNCNTCLTAIKEGEVRYVHDPDTVPNQGSCLTCVSVPAGKVILDA